MKLNCILLAVVLLALGATAALRIEREPDNILHLHIIETPAQTAAEWPPAIPNPLDNRPPLPTTPNLALHRPAIAGTQIHLRDAINATDGMTTSFWESARLPALFTLDMEETHHISTVAVALNPMWESRSQVFEILGSECGEEFFEIVESGVHFFTPSRANTVRIDFDPVYARYIRLIFTANTAQYTSGAQIAEIMVF